ncbi:hypothetical protein BHM03_00049344 [Ensete ventricosum]|nr:hypothetical protein BHM03_00049344 [Ensete ventricosum]
MSQAKESCWRSTCATASFWRSVILLLRFVPVTMTRDMPTQSSSAFSTLIAQSMLVVTVELARRFRADVVISDGFMPIQILLVAGQEVVNDHSKGASIRQPVHRGRSTGAGKQEDHKRPRIEWSRGQPLES